MTPADSGDREHLDRRIVNAPIGDGDRSGATLGAGQLSSLACPSPKAHPVDKPLIFRLRSGDTRRPMISTLLYLLRLFPFLCGGHRQLALEHLALRQQLAVYKRTVNRPKLRRSDRLFWLWLPRLWAGWRAALVIVAPDTVLRWQRRRFREHWTKISGRPAVGRPPVNAEIKALVIRMAAANPLWGAPRIHGELLKLGIDVAERTVSRLIPKRRTPPSQTIQPTLTPSFRGTAHD